MTEAKIGQPQTPGTAIASLVLGILGLVVCPVLALIGLVLGYQARASIRREPDKYTGQGMAVAGIIMGWVSVLVSLVGIALLVFVVGLGRSAPTEANLDTIAIPTTSGGAGAPTSTPASADGTWNVVQGDDVFVGYRMEELFGGQTIKKTAAGRTPAVTGTIEVDGATISSATFTADVTELKSDEARRDGALGSRGLETETFPEATFELTEPIALSGAPKQGEEVTVSATGDLTLHGVTKPVTLDLTAKWTGSAITVAGNAPIVLADFGMEVIEIPGFVTTDDHGTLELQLVLEPA